MLSEALFIELGEYFEVIFVTLIDTFGGDWNFIQLFAAVRRVESPLIILVHLQVFDGNSTLRDPANPPLDLLPLRELLTWLVHLGNPQAVTSIVLGRTCIDATPSFGNCSEADAAVSFPREN